MIWGSTLAMKPIFSSSTFIEISFCTTLYTPALPQHESGRGDSTSSAPIVPQQLPRRAAHALRVRQVARILIGHARA